jgi:flagellar basal body-associated protein FliL
MTVGAIETEVMKMDMKKAILVIAIIVIAALAAWQYGLFGGQQQTPGTTTQPPATTETPTQPPATTETPTQPSTTN